MFSSKFCTPRHGSFLFRSFSDDSLIRLSKLMAQRKVCSRREADNYISRGMVHVNDELVNVLGTKVPQDAKIELLHPAKRHQNRKVTILLNKPLGYVSSQPEDDHTPAVKLLTAANEFHDPKLRKGKFQRASSKQRVEPIYLSKLAVCGRLDINSTGLLIFTQDGTVAREIISAESKVEKEYLVRINTNTNELQQDAIDLLEEGLTLDGVKLRPVKVDIINEDQLRMTLLEGRHRQIRKMCEAVGLKVIALKRVRIGNITLGSLPVGQWRYLHE